MDSPMDLVTPVASRPYTLAQLFHLWQRLGDVMVSEDERLEEPFLHFAAGTPQNTVWHWFEAQHKDFIAGDVMSGRMRVYGPMLVRAEVADTDTGERWHAYLVDQPDEYWAEADTEDEAVGKLVVAYYTRTGYDWADAEVRRWRAARPQTEQEVAHG